MLTLKTCRWLYAYLSILTLVRFTTADCPFPKQSRRNLRFVYQSPTDADRRFAPEKYRLRFACSPEYTRIGRSSIRCLEGKWTSVVPICKKRECRNPPKIQNGNFSLIGTENEDTIIGSVAFYSCHRGYELQNDSESSLTCVFNPEENSADWIGGIPSCKEKNTCPDPGKSNDGDRKGLCCFSGDVLQFSCNDDFELVGSSKITCLPTGSWDSRRPLCEPKEVHCELPPKIPNGITIGEKDGDYFNPYDEVEILCQPGYFFKGPAQYIMCEEDGVWENEFGECEEIFCDPPEELENGTIPEMMTSNLTSFPYNFEISYECNEGYRLVGGDSWRFCSKSGWTGKTPYCEKIHCPDPGAPEHGSREGSNFDVGEKVLFDCFAGYYLLGSFERYCMPNGQWTGELARCDTETNYCPDTGIPINGFKNSSRYDVGTRVGFRCRPEYTLVGSEVRECQQNRTWSGKEARCIGPYDYDNIAQIRDTLKIAMAQKAEEQEKEIQKYQEELAEFLRNPGGRSLDLSAGRYILYFIFDTSGSVGRANFQKSIDFAKAIVTKVGIKETGARAGAITFSSEAVIKFLPLDHKDTPSVLRALDEIEFTGGGTSTNSALQLVREEMMPLTAEHVGKIGVKSVIFILTDGRANMGGDPKEEAAILTDSGVEIFCIGITGDIRKDTLYKIASDPKEEHVFILNSYSSFPWIIQEIMNGSVDYSQCGLGMDNAALRGPRGRILGGQKASEPWPWMAALYMLPLGSKDPMEAKLKCGGTIIHEKFILTAAHCLYDRKTLMLRKKTEVMVKLGITNVNNETFVQEPEIENFIIHPQYRPGKFDYDIALLQLNTPIEFNAHIRPVCLPPAELPENSALYKSKEYGMATGWGHDGVVKENSNVNLKSVEHLKQLRLPIKSKKACVNSLKDNKWNMTLFTDRMFCAGYEQGGIDTCQGDSGGPFMRSHINSEGYLYWTQVGIISWGQGCGLANTYGFYTHVQQLRIWIDNNIEEALKQEVADEKGEKR